MEKVRFIEIVNSIKQKMKLSPNFLFILFHTISLGSIGWYYDKLKNEADKRRHFNRVSPQVSRVNPSDRIFRDLRDAPIPIEQISSSY